MQNANATESANAAQAPLETTAIFTPLLTTSEEMKTRLEKTGTAQKCLPYHQKAMKLAVFRYLAQTFGIKDKDILAKAWQQFDATPGWFATNASACRQALWDDVKTPKAELKELIDPMAD